MATTGLNSKANPAPKKDIVTKKGTPAKEYGLLIDYEWCTGCHSCEVGCQVELGLKAGTYGIKVFEHQPFQTPDGKWDWRFLPMPTALCNLCQDRTEMGKLPNCVHHCQSNVMYYGPIDELAQKLKEKPTQVLYSL